MSIIIPPQEFLNQIPNMFYAVNREGQFVYANDITARWIGFNCAEDILGLTYQDMKCDAGELHEEYDMQDRKAGVSSTPTKIVAHLTYADDIRLLLGNKSGIFDADGKLLGVLSNFTNYKNAPFINEYSLFSNEKAKSSDSQVTYEISNLWFGYDLTEKEIECLFYYVRGWTAKELAELLHRSQRTIENHFYSIKQKMDCKKRSQVVEKCLASGFFNIIPEGVLFRKNK